MDVYEPGKILLVGGCPAYRCEGAPPVATAEAIDLLADPPVWRDVGAMSSPRHSHHATLLPDGRESDPIVAWPRPETVGAIMGRQRADSPRRAESSSFIGRSERDIG